MARRLAVLAAALALVPVACSDDGHDPAAGPTTTTGPAPTTVAEDPSLAEVPCWWPEDELADVPDDVTITCATLDVPADRADADGGTVTLAVARLHHADGDASAPPVVDLHGGPGGDSLVTAPVGRAGLDILADRDVVLFDQRGAGRSEPSLDCPEKEEAMLATLGAAEPFAVELERNREAVRACRDRLVADGVDLDDYDTPASVADMESLRRALGTDTWDVWGVSYGTRLGLAYAREHPDRVRSLLIDSVYPPDAGGVDYVTGLPGGAMERLVAACADDPACAAAVGDLGEVLAEAQAALDAEPEVLTATVDVEGTEVTQEFAITGTDMRAGLFAALYESELIPILPTVATQLAAGERGIVPQFLELGIPRLVGLSEGAFYSVECADGGRLLAGPEAAEELAAVDDDALVALNSAQVFCADWPVEPLPASFNEQVVVDVPTLVFGGTLDPITPYDGTVAQFEALPDARLVTVPNAGHGVGGFDDCTREARTTFWRDPSAPLPTCTEAIEGVAFDVG